MATRTLSTFPTRSPARPFGPRQAWSLVCAMVQARTTRQALADMDPHQLADIGVSPADAHMEASRPFWDVAFRR